jgi:hypothetical protein
VSIFKKAKQSDDDHAWNLYRASRNRVTKKIREAKHEFVEEAISQAENKTTDMWDKLKQLLPSKKTNTNCTILKDNNAVFKETRYIAECFKNYFCSVGHELRKHFDYTLPTVQDQMPKNSYTIPSITAEFIENEINRMSTSKATGLYGISVKLLKLSSNSIGIILAYILNFSLSLCIFANDWKKARVTPLFKAEDKCLVNKYRPVSILPCVSKILERHAFNSFYDFLSENSLITDCQSGFRPNTPARVLLFL